MTLSTTVLKIEEHTASVTAPALGPVDDTRMTVSLVVEVNTVAVAKRMEHMAADSLDMTEPGYWDEQYGKLYKWIHAVC